VLDEGEEITSNSNAQVSGAVDPKETPLAMHSGEKEVMTQIGIPVLGGVESIEPLARSAVGTGTKDVGFTGISQDGHESVLTVEASLTQDIPTQGTEATTNELVDSVEQSSQIEKDFTLTAAFCEAVTSMSAPNVPKETNAHEAVSDIKETKDGMPNLAVDITAGSVQLPKDDYVTSQDMSSQPALFVEACSTFYNQLCQDASKPSGVPSSHILSHPAKLSVRSSLDRDWMDPETARIARILGS